MQAREKPLDCSPSFKVNYPFQTKFTSEGQLVIVNPENGNYYSFNKTGGDLWISIEEGFTTNEIIDTTKAAYKITHDNAENLVTEFVTKLLNHKIISPSHQRHHRNHKVPSQISNKPTAQPTAFEIPILSKYNNIQQLVLLAPAAKT